jgi:hypothetical protein
LLLAVLLVLLGMSTAPRAELGYGGPHSASVIGGSGSATSSTHASSPDPLRLSPAAQHTSTTAQPGTWWDLCPRVSGGRGADGRPSIGAVDRAAMRGSVPVPRSSRAPPPA